MKKPKLIKVAPGVTIAEVRLLQNAPYGEQNLLKDTEITVSVGQAQAWLTRGMCEQIIPDPKRKSAAVSS